MASEEERSFQQCNTLGIQENLGEIRQRTNIVELDRTCDKQLDGCCVGAVVVKTGLMKSFCKTTTRAVELWRQRFTRAARGRGVCGAGAPAVRPLHVEVHVEEKAARLVSSTASQQRLEECIAEEITDFLVPRR